ncbi:MAG: hypothetical protein IKE04_05050 [Oscillospiraceae bacterium]|nr:hypothetical protein [Oscillospiraceae bacterium]
MKRAVAILLLVVVLGVCTAASAYTNSDNIYNVKDFKFHQYKNGIGCGPCPVYTAPSTSAYRVGKATVDTNAEVYIAGADSGWLLVRYETNNGGVRVGYIPPSYTSRFKFNNYNYMENINYSYIPCIAQDSIPISDNPKSNFSSFATIWQGQQYYIMATYTYYGNWWYVETFIDGQPTRGFISRDATRVVTGYADGNSSYSSNTSTNGRQNSSYDPKRPERSPLGTPCLGELTITMDPTIVRKNANPNTDMVGRVHNYETYPYYEYKTGSTGSIWYYIYVYDQNVWGWVSGARCRVK